jgi:hypothetical protein
MAAESAFAVNVPEAEPYVEVLRNQFDPSAKLGVPAHITVLYPFMSPDQIGAAVLEKVRRSVAQGEYPTEQIEKQLWEALPAGGIEASCREVVLIENSSGLWKPMRFFALPLTKRRDGGG